MKQPKIEIRPIETLKNWENNPRDISPEAFERLKKQIEELDIYKPLLIHTDGTVLGGNMRLRAFREMGVKEVTVSVVNAPTEEMKIKYALSDNDQVGYTDKPQLDELLSKYPSIQLSEYAVYLQQPITLDVLSSSHEDITKEWTGMPEFGETPAFDAYKSLMVHFQNEDDVKNFQDLVEQQITDKTKYIWYPKREKENNKQYVIKSEEE